MTREEAVKIFNTVLLFGKCDCPMEEIEECLNMAIKALEQESAIPIPTNVTNKDMFKVVFGYEPATDAVVCNKEDWCGASEPCNYCTVNPNNIGREENWWNAPYKVESDG